MPDEQTTRVLEDLNLEDLVPRFFQEIIALDIINKLSIDEFRKLGFVNRSDIMKLRQKYTVYGSYCPRKVAGNGAPKFDMPKLLLQKLIKEGFTVAEMSLANLDLQPKDALGSRLALSPFQVSLA